MFTGIIEHFGEVVSVEKSAGASRLWLKTAFNDVKLGESIAVNGCCLTVAAIDDDCLAFDCSPETLRLSNCDHLTPNARLNLERAMLLSDRLGGHIVTGHVDGQLRLTELQQRGDYTCLRFCDATPEAMQYLIYKGSIALNGVSLTINAVLDDGVEVMVIPHTWQHTNLSNLKINDLTNVEYDYIAKIVRNQTMEVVA